MRGQTPITREEAFSRLRAMGVAQALVSFSGGNDEGGVDGIRLVMADGSEGALGDEDSVHRAHGDFEYDEFGVPFKEGVWLKRTDARVTVPNRWRGGDMEVSVFRPATDAERAQAELGAALGSPVYERYGSFAGDFDVSGTITWDVTDGQVKSGYAETEWVEREEVW